MPDSSTTTTTPAGTTTTITTDKPGAQTSELYVSLFAKLLGVLAAFGVFGGEAYLKIAGLAVVAFATVGYAISRGLAKGGAALVLLVALGLGGSQLTACTAAQKAAAKSTAIACAYSDALPLVSDVVKDVNDPNPAAALESTAVAVGEDAFACAVKIWVAVQNASKPSTSQPTKGELAARAFLAGKVFAK